MDNKTWKLSWWVMDAHAFSVSGLEVLWNMGKSHLCQLDEAANSQIIGVLDRIDTFSCQRQITSCFVLFFLAA